MVVSLYVCEIPDNVTREDLENIFIELEGFLELRTKSTNDRKKIAFADFINERDANFAKKFLQNFKFTKEDKGLNLKLSDNSKKSNRSYDPHQSYTHQKRRRSFSDRSDISNKKDDNNLNTHHHPNNPTTTPTLPSMDNNINPFLKLLTSQSSITPPNPLNPIKNTEANAPETNQLVDLLNNLQAVQLLYNRQQQQQQQQQLQGNAGNAGNVAVCQKTSSLSTSGNVLHSFDDDFHFLSNFKRNATHIVYVEGIPVDATEREVAHIFRPFPGYRSLRLIQKDKNGDKNLICFADFENIIQSTICINTLQGYRFDKNDLVGLRFSYGVSKNKK